MGGERENDKANGLNCKQLVMLCIGHTDVPCIIRSSKFENTTKLKITKCAFNLKQRPSLDVNLGAGETLQVITIDIS